MPEWVNWAGSVRCAPQVLAMPQSEAELCALVREAAARDRVVRVAGTGHSFTPLVASDGVVVSLERLRGVESSDRDALEATLRAGSVLRDLGDPLLELGMAMENLGDVDVQTLAGALSTGTHGTGRTLGNLSSRVAGLRVVDARGEIVEWSAGRDADILRAARVSLGALGVITAARMRLVPAYRLHERVRREPAAACLEQLDELCASHRHCEFFWYPREDVAELKTLQPTEAAPDDLPGRDGERIGWAPHVIPSVREHRFHEMEYSVPAGAGVECFAEVRSRIREKHPGVAWPVEYRTLAPDDALLSTASGRETVTLSVHQDGRLPFRDFFADVESIFRAFAGRPHWGKIHTRSAAELRDLYPEWERFHAVRRRLDPGGRFLNDYLRGLFGA